MPLACLLSPEPSVSVVLWSDVLSFWSKFPSAEMAATRSAPLAPVVPAITGTRASMVFGFESEGGVIPLMCALCRKEAFGGCPPALLLCLDLETDDLLIIVSRLLENKV